MIWLKRLLPLVVLGLAAGGYALWDKWSAERELRDENRLALVTAQVWIATAKYRNEPEKYLAFRDSLLESADVPREKVLDFFKDRERRPEELLPFAQKVKRLVDSLFHMEDSMARDTTIRSQDSVRETSMPPIDIR